MRRQIKHITTRFFIGIFLIIGISKVSHAQSDSLLVVDIMDYLPPLPIILDSALANAPQVARFESQLESTEYDVSLAKKDWANDIRFQAGYTWTLGNQLVLQGIATGGSDEINEGYNYGVAVSIPLSSWYGRSDRIARAEALRGMQQGMVDEAAYLVREMVIETYNELLMLQRLLKITSESKESARLIAEIAEERFRDGELSLEELSAVTDYKSRSAVEYEQYRTAFSNAYTQLERLAGFSFRKMN